MANAAKNHRKKKEVVDMLANIDRYADDVLMSVRDGSYQSRLEYHHFKRMNSNGKLRNISSPSLYTRVLQHLFLLYLLPTYYAADPGIALNCKTGCGIMASWPNQSVLSKLKRLVYSRREYRYALIIDQRQCYAHITRKLFRKMLGRLFREDPELVSFGVDVCFDGNVFPIGTPTSPPAHHVVMLGFDRWLGGVAPFKIRYADDCLLAFRTKEEAQEARWRVANYWWYEMRILAKTSTARIVNLDREPLSFCGVVVRRSFGTHSRGYAVLRKNIRSKARRCRKASSWPSYYGMLSNVDGYRTMKSIEAKMNLSELTSKVKIERPLDAAHIDIQDLCGKIFSIRDYEIRCDKEGRPNWLKMLIGLTEGEKREKAFEVHGEYRYMVEFLKRAEDAFGKEALLPLTGMEIEKSCGYIFKGSTNRVESFPST